MEIESRSVVAWGWGYEMLKGLAINRHKATFGANKNVLKLVYG